MAWIMKCRIYVVIITFCVVTNIYAQPQAQWITDYDAQAHECFNDVFANNDGSYIAVGGSGEAWNTGGRWFMVRADENGRVEWSHAFGNNQGGAMARTVIEADNGDFVAAGTNAYNGQVDVMRVDPDGEPVWRRQYLSGEGRAIIELKAGQFLICGKSGQLGFLLLIQGDGQELWNHTYSISDQGGYGYFNSMRETDGQVVVAGEGQPSNNQTILTWIIKADMDGEGELIWDKKHRAGDYCGCNTIISCEGGFVVSGWSTNNNTYLMKINHDGDLVWTRLYDVESFREYGFCLAVLDNGNYVIAGQGQERWQFNHMPMLIYTDPNGAEIGRSYYDLSQLDGFQVGQHAFYSVVLGRDDCLVGAGLINSVNSGYNGMLMKMEPSRDGPYFLSWTPEDTMLTVLQGDSIQFTVHARHQWGAGLRTLWYYTDGDTIAADSTVTERFEDLGEYSLNCEVTDGAINAVITWHINVVEFFISSVRPDSEHVFMRRNVPQDFLIELSMLDNIQFDYTWHIRGRDIDEDLNAEDSLRVELDLPGRYELTVEVTDGIATDGNLWTLDVVSPIWSWIPEQLELEVSEDTQVYFAVMPFNPDSDSLTYYWIVGEDTLGNAQEFEFDFQEIGQYILNCVLYDGADADSVMWKYDCVNTDRAGYLNGIDVPRFYEIRSVYPNPFNSSVTIEYRLAQNGDMRISVFDIEGRIVDRLIDGFGQQGTYDINWNADRVQSGIYFIILETDSEKIARKVVLVR